MQYKVCIYICRSNEKNRQLLLSKKYLQEAVFIAQNSLMCTISPRNSPKFSIQRWLSLMLRPELHNLV